MRVLLVEDDDTIASPLVRGLEREGFRVEHAECGADALTAMRATPSDVVLLDLGLPDVDGFGPVAASGSGCSSCGGSSSPTAAR